MGRHFPLIWDPGHNLAWSNRILPLELVNSLILKWWSILVTGRKGKWDLGFWRGVSLLAGLSLSCKCPPSPIRSQWSVGGLGAGHSCFPFLQNATAAIWTRPSLRSPDELLCRPLCLSRQAWSFEPWPQPHAPLPDPCCPISAAAACTPLCTSCPLACSESPGTSHSRWSFGWSNSTRSPSLCTSIQALDLYAITLSFCVLCVCVCICAPTHLCLYKIRNFGWF